jgi:LmbE family N-acetylglucosaminyl deacetylase
MAVCREEGIGGRVSRLHRGIVWRIVACAASLLFWGGAAAAQFPSAPGTGPGLPETIEAIDSARVTTRILFITAHPDDEPPMVLTYLARGLHAEVALLTITHGEGGQNALGPEQGPRLGLIRTQELLAATRGYGVKLYFTRAPDFGYSKTKEETLRVWGDQVLEDMVRVIRIFRPNIVINGWAGVRGGHGHHQAAGLLTPKAVQLAADPSYMPRKLAMLDIAAGVTAVWGTKEKPVVLLGIERGSEKPKGYVLPLDEVSPLYGKTWREIGIDAFANHRSQGLTAFLTSPFARRPIGLVLENGSAPDPRILARPLSEYGCTVFQDADRDLAEARKAVLDGEWGIATRKLAAAAAEGRWDRCIHITSGAGQELLLAEGARIREKIERALALAAGFRITAEASRSEVVAGNSFDVAEIARCRQEVHCVFGDLKLELPKMMSETKRAGNAEQGYQLTIQVNQIPEIAASSDPASALLGDWSAERKAWNNLLPEPAPLLVAGQPVTIAGYTFSLREPLTHVQASSVRADRVPLRLVPALTLAIDPKQAVQVAGKPRQPLDVFVHLHSFDTNASRASVGVEAPAGWMRSSEQEIEVSGQADQYLHFTVTPPEKLAAGSYTISAYAKRGEERFTASLEPLPSLPAQFWIEPAESLVKVFDIQVPENLLVGYVTAEGEPIPEALGRLGIHVEMLDAAALAFGDLGKFDALVVGVRAYELRPDLAAANARLLHYAEQGGTLVVQYNRDFIWDRLQPAPYPAKIGNPTPRITDENSPVRFLQPADPVLNAPNKITQEDFQGWVQERGLYYWSQFDAKYTAVLAMNDPGEAELTGGLVYTRYGKGVYIYTGLAFFRQLPEGVPGAYRLFVNLLSASRAH